MTTTRTGIALCATAAACFLLGTSIDSAPWNHPSPAAIKTTTVAADPSTLLSSILPYYHEDPPSWCAEDMICWEGTTADGRTDRQLMNDLPCDILYTTWMYSDQPTIDEQDMTNICPDYNS